MTSAEKKLIAAYFATIILSATVYSVKNLLEQRKLTKRIKRYEAFLAESEAFKKKHKDAGTFNEKTAVAEFFEIMRRHGL